MRKSMKRILAMFIMVFMVTSLCTTAFAATVRTPKADGQNKNHWCWATSAKIVAEHNGGTTLPSDAQVLTNTNGLHSNKGVAYYGQDSSGAATANGVQRAIVVKIKGSDADNGGGDSDKTAALQYASKKTMSVGTFGSYQTALSSSQISTIKSDLNSGKYVIGNMVSGGYGHSVAILAYRSSDDKYRITDPWDLTDVYYSSSSIFSTAGFPVFGSFGRIEWIQYCR